MADDYVSNTAISMPISIPKLLPEINFGGLMFSFTNGLVYPASTQDEARIEEPKGL